MIGLGRHAFTSADNAAHYTADDVQIHRNGWVSDTRNYNGNGTSYVEVSLKYPFTEYYKSIILKETSI